MNNVFSVSDFIGKTAGVRPGSLIWSAYPPQEATAMQDGLPVGIGLYFERGLAYWNLAWSVSPGLQGPSPENKPGKEPFLTYVLLQHLIDKDLGNMPLTDLAGCMTLPQFVEFADKRQEDLTRWTRAGNWPRFFDPHEWVSDLKRLT